MLVITRRLLRIISTSLHFRISTISQLDDPRSLSLASDASPYLLRTQHFHSMIWKRNFGISLLLLLLFFFRPTENVTSKWCNASLLPSALCHADVFFSFLPLFFFLSLSPSNDDDIHSSKAASQLLDFVYIYFSRSLSLSIRHFYGCSLSNTQYFMGLRTFVWNPIPGCFEKNFEQQHKKKQTRISLVASVVENMFKSHPVVHWIRWYSSRDFSYVPNNRRTHVFYSLDWAPR